MSDKYEKTETQPDPSDGVGGSCHELVIADLMTRFAYTPAKNGVIDDLAKRKQFGMEKYGKLLKSKNGRDAKLDLYEELLDALVYAKQTMEEIDYDIRDNAGDTTLVALLREQRHAMKQIYANLLSSALELWNIRDDEVFTNS